MGLIKTPRDAKGFRNLTARPKSTRDILTGRVPIRTVHNLRHVHSLKGIRTITRIGWEQWESKVAQLLHSVEKQRLNQANRYYIALDRIGALLEQAARQRNELQASAEEMQAANEELEATNEELQSTTEEVERASAYNRSLIDASLDPLVTINPDGTISDVNAATEAVTGRSRDELIGTDFSNYFTEPEKARAGYQEAFERGSVQDYALDIRHRDGRVTSVLYNASVFRDAAGNVVGVFAAARDVTELRRMQETMNRRAEDLGRSNAELEQFAYVASHDLQEPLRTVSSYAQLLVQRYHDRLDKDAQEFIDFIVDGAKRMQTLINDLLTFSRVGTSGKPLEPTDCQTALDQALSNLATAVEESAAVVTHDELPTVTADAAQLAQLFQNLIGNAIKFRGERRPEVHVGAKCKGMDWLFSVRDNGLGIDMQYAERIFVIFQRLHSRSEYPGTGIGLAVCKKIAERHGGRIWVESQPGEGSTFYFTIPAHREA